MVFILNSARGNKGLLEVGAGDVEIGYACVGERCSILRWFSCGHHSCGHGGGGEGGDIMLSGRDFHHALGLRFFDSFFFFAYIDCSWGS